MASLIAEAQAAHQHTSEDIWQVLRIPGALPMMPMVTAGFKSIERHGVGRADFSLDLSLQGLCTTGVFSSFAIFFNGPTRCALAHTPTDYNLTKSVLNEIAWVGEPADVIFIKGAEFLPSPTEEGDLLLRERRNHMDVVLREMQAALASANVNCSLSLLLQPLPNGAVGVNRDMKIFQPIGATLHGSKDDPMTSMVPEFCTSLEEREARYKCEGDGHTFEVQYVSPTVARREPMDGLHM